MIVMLALHPGDHSRSRSALVHESLVVGVDESGPAAGVQLRASRQTLEPPDPVLASGLLERTGQESLTSW